MMVGTKKAADVVKETTNQEVYVQFAGKEVETENLIEQVKDVWTAEGNSISAIKSLALYIKPEDMAAYYVINGEAEGKIDL